jgi:hypothetical protein
MNALNTATLPTYATGYAEGRHAAKEHIAGYANPHPRNTPAYQGWTDGHYDEQSARRIHVQRTSAAVWAHED